MQAARIVERTVNSPVMWLYYSFCREYGREPSDFDDFVDGLACARARNEIEELYAQGE